MQISTEKMSQLKSLIMLPRRVSVLNTLVIYLTIVGIFCISPSSCSSNNIASNGTVTGVTGVHNSTAADSKHLSHNLTLVISADSSTSKSNSSSGEDYYDDYSDNEESRRIRDNSKIAQIVVYFSVIFIALAGVMIKYFVTQYETSQLKAQEQLNYQRLQHA